MAYGYYRSVTLAQPASDLTDFPVVFVGTYSYLATVANGGKVENANGYDIAFFSDAALTTALDFELVEYAPTTGKIEAHFRVGTLASASATVVYMAYGDSGISTFQGNVDGTWQSSFKGVYHLKDGTTLSAVDSSGLGNDGTITSVGVTTGQVGGAANYTGNASIIIPNMSNYINGVTAHRLSAWFKPSNVTSNAHGAVAAVRNNDTNDSFYIVQLASSKNIEMRFRNSSGTAYTITLTNVLTLSTWVHLALVHDGSTLRTYVDGSASTTAACGGSIGNNGRDLQIGRDQNSTVHYVRGAIDEVRFEAATPTAVWLLAEYNNQYSASTFYTMGSETTPATSTGSGAGSIAFAGSGTAAVTAHNPIATGTGSITWSGSGTTKVAVGASGTIALWPPTVTNLILQSAHLDTSPWAAYGTVSVTSSIRVIRGSGNPDTYFDHIYQVISRTNVGPVCVQFDFRTITPLTGISGEPKIALALGFNNDRWSFTRDYVNNPPDWYAECITPGDSELLALDDLGGGWLHAVIRFNGALLTEDYFAIYPSGAYGSDGDWIELANLQLEEASTPGTYVESGASYGTIDSGIGGSGTATITSGVVADGSGGGAFAFGGSGTAKVAVAASGGGACVFAGSGTAKEPLSAVGSGAFSWLGSAVALVSVLAHATGAVAWSGSGTAVHEYRTGAGGGSVAFAGSGSVAVAVSAAGTGAVVWAGSGTSQASVNAAGSGALSFAGSGAATVLVRATGSGAAVWAGSGTALSDESGIGTGGIFWGGSGSAAVAVRGNGAGAVSWAGSGSAGVKDTLATGTGAVVWEGAGLATVLVQASGSGAVVWEGTGASGAQSTGHGGGAVSWAGSGVGMVPVSASGGGAVSWSGSGSTSIPVSAAGTGAIPWAGSGAATVLVRAAGSGAVAFAGSGTVAITFAGAAIGSGSGAVSWDGSGIGLVDVHAAGTGVFLFAGSGTGTVPPLALVTTIRPVADVTDGSWLNELGSAVDLFASVDDEPVDDATWIQSSLSASPDVCEVALGDPGGTPPPGTVTLFLRYQAILA